jgi:hypothetical protein
MEARGGCLSSALLAVRSRQAIEDVFPLKEAGNVLWRVPGRGMTGKTAPTR